MQTEGDVVWMSSDDFIELCGCCGSGMFIGMGVDELCEAKELFLSPLTLTLGKLLLRCSRSLFPTRLYRFHPWNRTIYVRVGVSQVEGDAKALLLQWKVWEG